MEPHLGPQSRSPQEAEVTAEWVHSDLMRSGLLATAPGGGRSWSWNKCRKVKAPVRLRAGGPGPEHVSHCAVRCKAHNTSSKVK